MRTCQNGHATPLVHGDFAQVAAIILALSISFVCLKCVETHARTKIGQKNSLRFVLNELTLMDIFFFTGSEATGLVPNLCF